MKTVNRNGYEIAVVDRRDNYEDRWAEYASMVGWDSRRLFKRQLEGSRLQQSLKNKKPRD